MRNSFSKSSYLAIIDQILVSGGNYVVVFLLARNLTKDEFGIFVIAHSILMFSRQIQLSLIEAPIGVLVSPLSDTEARAFISAVNSGQWLISSVMAGFAILVAGTLLLWDNTKYYFPSFISVAIINFFYLNQSYIRYILFSRTRLADALKNDLICYGTQGLAMILLLYNNALNVVNAILGIGITSLIAWLYGLYQCKDIIGKSKVSMLEGLRPCVNYGKYLLGSGVIAWCRANIHLYLALYYLGVTAPAILKAVQTLFGPTHIFLNGLESVIPQSAARLYKSDGSKRLNKFIWNFCILFGLCMFSYVAVVAFFGETVLNTLYKGKYAGYGGLVGIIALQYLVISIQTGPNILLRVRNFPKLIFKANVIDFFISGILAIVLIYTFGIYGAAAVKVISALIILTLLLIYHGRININCM